MTVKYETLSAKQTRFKRAWLATVFAISAVALSSRNGEVNEAVSGQL